MRLLSLVPALLVTLVVAGPNVVSAAVITTTYDGVVSGSSTIDSLGVFGPRGDDLAGAQFSLVYTTNESAPGASASFTGNTVSYITTSTKAVLTINGKTFNFPEEDGLAITFANSNYYGGWGLEEDAYTLTSNIDYGIGSSVSSEIDKFTPSYLYFVPFSHTVNTHDIVNQFASNSFYIFNVPDQQYIETIDLYPATIRVTRTGAISPPSPLPPGDVPPGIAISALESFTAMPEPGSWALALAGLAAIGAMLRRGRGLPSPAKVWNTVGSNVSSID